MKKRLSLLLVTAAAFSAFVGVSQASAATEFGSGCAADEVFPFGGAVSIAHGPGSPLPVAAPTSGILTEWRTNIALTGITPEEEAVIRSIFGQQLVVLRPTGGRYIVVGKSESTSVITFNGVSTFPARIPIQQGDLLGLQGTLTLICETAAPTDAAALFFGSAPVGESVFVEETTAGLQVPVTARIEPDVDGDGYGDETQDKCPQSAAYQTPCPVVTISSLPTVAKKAVTVYVSTSLSAPVGVTASVKLPKGKPVTITAPAQTVAPGTQTRFKLTLNGKVNKALKELPTNKSLKMTITASATNVTGAPSTTVSTAKLKGQMKPK